MPRAPESLVAMIRAARPLAHANVAPPLVYGQALAFAITGSFSIEGLAIAHGFGVLDHLFIVLANDFADRHDDARNRSFNAFSGGSRVIPEGLLPARAILGGAIASAALLLGASVALAGSHPLLPWLAGVAILLLLAYSYPPLRLSYRGGGEWLQAIGVGVVLPIVGFHAQGGAIADLPAIALLPTMVLGLAGNVLTSLPDEPADREAGKRTWAVRRGVPRALRDALALTAIAIAIGAGSVPLGSHLGRVVTTAIPLGVLGTALPYASGAFASGARAPSRAILFRAMLAAGAASTAAILAWSIALFAGG